MTHGSTITLSARLLLAATCIAAAPHGGQAQEPPIRWTPPAGFDPQAAGLGLPVLEGVSHAVVYDPKPCAGNVDEGGDGRYESLGHGTYNHHPCLVLFEDKMIAYWTNHSRDENGPGERTLAKIGTFNADRSDIDWGGDDTLVELAPAPVAVKRRRQVLNPAMLEGANALAGLHVINGKLYAKGRIVACHGWTNDVQYHGVCDQPIPAEHWSNDPDAPGFAAATGFCSDVWWDLGWHFVQRWKISGRTLAPDSALYALGTMPEAVEVTPGVFKKVEPLLAPYTEAVALEQAPAALKSDVMEGVPLQFGRKPLYAPGTSQLATDGKNGLSHETEFRRPDGKWVAVRDNLLSGGQYYAALKDLQSDYYPPATRTNLYGQAMPVAGELPDGSTWIIGNNPSRTDMYLMLSQDGIAFDRTWLLLHVDSKDDGGLYKQGGPQYFQAITVGGNIWVVYSIGKIQVGITKIPIRLLQR